MTDRKTSQDAGAAGLLPEDALEDLFIAGRNALGPEAEAPSADLMARVLSDALAVQPVLRSAPVKVWQGLRGAFGGWPGLGGLALAGVAGLVVGLAGPTALTEGLSASWSATDAISVATMIDPWDTYDLGVLLAEDGI